MPGRRIVSGSLDYSLGQIDSKLGSIEKTLAEDRMSDAQFRTWIRGRVDSIEQRLSELEATEKVNAGKRSVYHKVWITIQFFLGLVGGSLAVILERWLLGGSPTRP